jgi:superfamily II DNA or RNA helicase
MLTSLLYQKSFVHFNAIYKKFKPPFLAAFVCVVEVEQARRTRQHFRSVGAAILAKPLYIFYHNIFRHYKLIFATALLIDEAHTASSVSIQSIAKHCVNAEYRLGFTGTVPKNEANRSTLFGYLGPISYELKAKELIDQGVISQIKINNLIMKYPQDCVKIGMDYQTEVKHIINYDKRNKALDYILENTDKTHNTLILVQRIEHLKAVKEYLEKNIE